MSGAATPRTSVRLTSSQVQPACRLRLPCRCCRPMRLSRFGSARCAWENLDTGQPFSYRYELRTQHRLESVATRTPPPICTSAQSPQTALVWKTVERREQLTVHDGWLMTITESHGCGDSSPTVAMLHVSPRNHLFDSPHRFSCVTKDAAPAKKFRKFFTFAVMGDRFQNE